MSFFAFFAGGSIISQAELEIHISTYAQAESYSVNYNGKSKKLKMIGEIRNTLRVVIDFAVEAAE